MNGQTYLLKSRHGVYYFRAIIPSSIRASLGLKKREIRISLRTKDKAKAKLLVAKKSLLMKHHLNDLMPWELDAEKRKTLYLRGLELIATFGEIDLDDPYALDALTDELGGQDLEAYIFAREEQKSLQLKKQRSAINAAPTQTATPSVLIKYSPTAIAAPAADEQKTDALIEEAIDRFLTSKKRRASPPTLEKYKSQLQIFAKIISNNRKDLFISQITNDDVRHYQETLQVLPKKISPQLQTPIEQLIKTPKAKIGAKTLFSHAQCVNMFLTWCEDQQYIINTRFARILKPSLEKPKNEDKEKAYQQLQLKLLFESVQYQSGTIKRASDYWLPLLGIFTGARQSELCQLELTDVKHDSKDNIYYFDFNIEGTKRLKTNASKRKTPVHSQLIRLGFLDFINNARQRGQTRLFPNEKRNTRGEFGAYSHRFNRYKEKCGIKNTKSTKYDFHSFRHNVISTLIAKGHQKEIVEATVGHAGKNNSETINTYSQGPSLETKKKLIEDLNYQLEFDKIKPNCWKCP